MLLFILLRINFSSMKHYFLYIFLLIIFSSCGGSKKTSDYSFLYEDEDGMEVFIDSLDLEENSLTEISLQQPYLSKSNTHCFITPLWL